MQNPDHIHRKFATDHRYLNDVVKIIHDASSRHSVPLKGADGMRLVWANYGTRDES